MVDALIAVYRPVASGRAGMPSQRVSAGKVSPFINSDKSPSEAPGAM
jgi:hypothetical protein